MKSLFIALVLLLLLNPSVSFAVQAGAGHSGGIKERKCAPTSQLNLKSSNRLSDYRFLCYGLDKEAGKTFYCETAQKNMDCGSVKLKTSAEKWAKALEKADNKNKKVLSALKDSKSYKSLLLASSVDLMALKKPMATGDRFRLQTGPYSKLTLDKKPLEVKCLEEILFAAQVLQREFGQFNFEVDGRIRQCGYLKEGITELLREKKHVTKNLRQIHSPMHTFYLTTKSKFNDDTLGEMGLYVNVDKKNEIKTRLVDFKLIK